MAIHIEHITRRYLIISVLYAVALSTLFTVALIHDGNMSLVPGEAVKRGINVSLLSVILLYYAGRLGLLYIWKTFRSPQAFAHAWYYGLWGGVIVDFIGIITAFNLLEEKVVTCQVTEFGCGWGGLVYIVLGAGAFVTQTIGSVIGLAIGKQKRKQAA